MTNPPEPSSSGQRLRELAGIFLRLGTTAFGGPAAHIAMMEQEFVRRRNWLTETEFLDMIAVANCIPGPSSTEVAIFVGYRRAGVWGLLIAGCCFILPAAILVAVIAWAYLQFGGLPVAVGILDGVKPVVIAVIVQAIWRLGKAAIKSWQMAVVGIVAAGASYLGANALYVLLGAGLVVIALRWAKLRWGATLPMLAWPLGSVGAGVAVSAPVAVGLWPLFLVFLKVGAVLFGSGYVLLAFLQAELVEQRHWMTQGQLLDAVAVGQVTPGPVFTTATFIGYLLAGPWGAGVATAAIFMPAFVFVGLTGRLLGSLRKWPLTGAFLDGLSVASLALMAVVTWQLGRAALVNGWTIALAVVSAIILIWRPINSAWLVLGGGLVGALIAGKG